eukprot:TRINITY_DN775948_c0_g1_i1.p1 TRINITY_DN775948_c0_g1~~TRINITY_DN775948_c0_g1_i1.p1  ORF type:complete len:661 (+),score=196.27 TRINITY_DN775948_c0_g1_i1:322-2304(+)
MAKKGKVKGKKTKPRRGKKETGSTPRVEEKNDISSRDIAMVPRNRVNDPCSCSNPNKIRVKHNDLKLEVDFDAQIVRGICEMECEVLSKNCKELSLDTRDLVIKNVFVKNAGPNSFLMNDNPPHETFGAELKIPLGDFNNVYCKAGEKMVKIAVEFETKPCSSAIQWLKAEQTAGKKHPYMFTQSQAIHARSFFPCQDTPGVKSTYEAEVKVPTGMVAAMSALNVGEPIVDGEFTTFKFKQSVVTPSYLVALVVGNLERKQIGERSFVMTEPEMLEESCEEFSETEEFIVTGEKFLGPYVWGEYTVLVLPPSFPYGGMENPCLTFVTPTLLAGDKSLADVVCHEITHSWTGNLVTCNTWEHFWLNEGFTMLVERKIVAEMHGEKLAECDAVIGLHALEDSIKLFGTESNFTRLIPDLENTDPDDAFSSVPYEKGFNFLRYLETLVGGAKAFNPFLLRFIEVFAHKTLTSADFRVAFLQYFRDLDLSAIDWDAWFRSTGNCPVENEFDRSLLDEANMVADAWIAFSPETEIIRSENDIITWPCAQQQVFMKRLMQSAASISIDTVMALDEKFNLSNVKNSEIKFCWQRLCLAVGHAPIVPAVLRFITTQGRMKFVRPLYRDLFKCSIADAKEQAVKTFTENIEFYHPIARKMIAKDLQVEL